MSRYRPPTQPGSQYITPEGAKRLRDELDRLWLDERPRVTAAVSEAAAQGDRSENAEYTYGKKRLHEIDRRVRFLRKRLDGMTIVDPAAGAGRRDPRRVYFGAWVQVDADTAHAPHPAPGIHAAHAAPPAHAGPAAGNLRWYRLVGPDEFDMAEDYISMDSPLGRALLGKRLDEEVTVVLPGGATLLTIVAISYAPRP